MPTAFRTGSFVAGLIYPRVSPWRPVFDRVELTPVARRAASQRAQDSRRAAKHPMCGLAVSLQANVSQLETQGLGSGAALPAQVM